MLPQATLRLPSMGPLTRAALFYDYVPRVQLPDQIEWDGELGQIVDNRLASVAQRMITDLAIEVPASVANRLQDAVFSSTASSYVAMGVASVDLALLGDSDIPFVITKGPGIARMGLRITDRPYSDIDIYVSSKHFERVTSLLRGAGYSEEDRNLLPWRNFNRYCREAVNLRSPRGGSIDVHHRIPPWIWGKSIGFSAVHSRANTVALPGGGEFICASAVDNLLISALHIVSDKTRPGVTLMAWRDFVMLSNRCDVAEVIEIAREAHLCGWLRWIIDALPTEARPRELQQALSGEDVDIRSRYRLAAITSAGIGSHRVVSPALRLPVLNALLYLAGMAWPSSEFLQSKKVNGRLRRTIWWKEGIAGLNQPIDQ